VIPLASIEGVRQKIAPGLSFDEATRRILEDLEDGGTLVSPYAEKPWRNQEVVWLFGKRWRYLARLYGYELPAEWCICPPKQRECRCRHPNPPKDKVAVWLFGITPISSREYTDIQDGEHLDTTFTREPVPAPVWFDQAAARWTAAHRRRRRSGDDRGALRRWRMVLEVRRLAVEYLAQPVAYDDVEVDEGSQLLFELSPGEGPVPLETIYEIPGHKTAKLRVTESDGSLLVCEVEGTDPVAACDFARGRRGIRRRLVRDQDATSSVLDREEKTFFDLLNGRARNPELRDLVEDPTRAMAPPRRASTEEVVQPKLDHAQREAVELAMRSRDMTLITGPPGTGKTTFIAELIVRHLRKHPGDRILMASQTHQATDHLLAQLHKLDRDIPLVRVGRDIKKIDTEVRQFWAYATEPWQSGVRERALRHRQHAQAHVLLGGEDPDLFNRIVTIQDQYLGSDGKAASAASRINQARVLAGTCYGVSSTREARELTYDLAIVEEAGKATPAEALMAIIRADRVLLVGDSRQLEPTPDRALDNILRQADKDPDGIEDPKLRKKAIELCKELDIERNRLAAAGHDLPPPFTAETLFTYLARRFAVENPGMHTTLTTQYRMISGIGELISQVFYEGQLDHGRQGPDEERDSRATAMTTAHVRLLDIDGEESTARGATSASNQQEVRVAVRELQALEKAAAASQAPGQEPLGVAVITGYLAQQRALRRAIDALQLHHLKIRHGLIDSFQGNQEEIVIVSMVRTNRAGFMYRPNRINVALSRAKSLVIVLVNARAARDQPSVNGRPTRHGKLGDPIKRVVEFIDQRIADGDPRYETESIQRGRKQRDPAGAGQRR
jgi:AAA domain